MFEAVAPFHKALAPESPRAELVHAEFDPPSSKKRKWEEEPFSQELFKFKDLTNSETKKPVFELELHLDTPFSADKWRQFLTIQSSGQIHLCNTRVNKTTTKTKTKTEEDSWRNNNPKPPLHHPLSLDLNLTYDQSLRKREDDAAADDVDVNVSNKKDMSSDGGDHHHHGGSIRSPSWLSASTEADQKEMVATVCMRCHMLVMLCKSSPSCPNCKFMHPPDHQNPSNFLKRRCPTTTLFC